ncbi:MAG: DUF86 domain-containing protein [Planctomycetes bacterium]|nr:DUF86 domain-containing protein [Planctomycetota bacterium]
MRDPRERLRDIVEAITRIQAYAPRGRAAFDSDELLQTFIVHPLQILGEAASRLPVHMRNRYPEVPWPKILGMRNILVHSYFRIGLDVVWAVVENDLSDLKPQMEAILRTEGVPPSA